MSFLLYLDQNILSDLRQRKIEESQNEQFRLLKYVLKSEQVTVVYSHVTLDEILQISKAEYREEHIEILAELNAKYIESLQLTLSNLNPDEVWSAHLENKQSNVAMGITALMEASQLSSRKISGLPIEESFPEINEKLKDSLNTLISKCEQQFPTIDIENLEEPLKSHFTNMQSQLDELKLKSSSLQAPKIGSEQQLGPQPFREMPGIKALEVQSLSAKEVVHAIEATFKLENSSFNFADYIENTPQTGVARAYSLMNWAGYYADDFTKNKKGKDRFNASNNDMQHAVSALGAGFLISNDTKFLKKAQVCFAYVNCQTIVCSSQEFIENYCKFV